MMPCASSPQQSCRWRRSSLIVLRHLRGLEAFGRGEMRGLVFGERGLTLPNDPRASAEPLGDLAVGGYRHGSWTGQWAAVAQFTELVTSWQATTPPGTWLRVDIQARSSSVERSRWFTLARWAYHDGGIHRASVPGQRSGDVAVDVDTLRADPGRFLNGYRPRLTLYAGDQQNPPSPALRGLSVMTSAIPDRATVATSTPAGTPLRTPATTPAGTAVGTRGGAPGGAARVLLDVPAYSQHVHRGHLPQFGGGGEAWCSPTSTRMVLDYWGCRLDPHALAWVGPNHPDPQVDHAARHTYDYAYRGTGNWSFNTAYAAHAGLDAYVTRLASLRDAERYLAGGVPLVLSLSFRADELDGAGYGTDGHLLVLRGIAPNGDAIVNDPAGGADAVCRVYDRGQFETAWLRSRRRRDDGTAARGPGGIAYVIRRDRAAATR